MSYPCLKHAVLAAAAIAALNGCAASPEPDYYALTALPGDVTPVATSITIERPVLPGYLDRPDFVRQTAGGGIEIDQGRNWAEPLDSQFETILAEDLRQRMPDSLIVSERDLYPAKTRLTLHSAIETFNRTENGDVLKAQFLLRADCGCAAAETQKIYFDARLPADLPAPKGLSQLIGSFADQLAVIVQNGK